jgi:NADPH:quinone reductase-like Zn-dependent oxidoreductase
MFDTKIERKTRRKAYIETSGLSVVGCRMETREEEEFAGRSVVITGAAGGIGIVLVQRFLTRGARVFAVDRDQDALDRLQAEHADLDSPLL